MRFVFATELSPKAQDKQPTGFFNMSKIQTRSPELIPQAREIERRGGEWGENLDHLGLNST